MYELTNKSGRLIWEGKNHPHLCQKRALIEASILNNTDIIIEYIGSIKGDT